MKRALAESCSSAHQVYPPGGGSAFFGAGGGRGGRSSFSAADFVESDLRATEEELEQAVSSQTHVDCKAGMVSGCLRVLFAITFSRTAKTSHPPHMLGVCVLSVPSHKIVVLSVRVSVFYCRLPLLAQGCIVLYLAPFTVAL